MFDLLFPYSGLLFPHYSQIPRCTYYAQNYAGIMYQSLEGGREGGREVRKCMIERMYTYILHIYVQVVQSTLVTRLSEKMRGHMQGSHAGVTCSGHMQGLHAGATCRGHMQGPHAGVICRGHMQGSHAGATCRGHMQGPHAGVTCRGHIQGSHAGVTCRGHM